MTTTINICLCTKDDKFIKYCASLLESLYRNRNKQSIYNIYILGWNISQQTKTSLNKFHDTNFHLIFVPIDENDFKKYANIKKKDYIYLYRLLMWDYLNNVDKIIYMDCDIIVDWDISELYAIDLWDNIVGAAKDCINWSLYGIYTLPAFFNSGVLLIDLKKRNHEHIWHQVLQLLNDRQHEFPMWQDQDWLNHILHGKWLPISPKWNGMRISTFSHIWTQYTQKEFYESRHPIIVHFAWNHNRPRWLWICVNPKRYLYYYYVFKTIWRDTSDVYKLVLRIFLSNFVTYFLYMIARHLFSKRIIDRRYVAKMDRVKSSLWL